MKHSMNTYRLIAFGLIVILCSFSFADRTFANEPQIPNIFLNNKTELKGKAVIHIFSREFGTSGTFTIKISASCAPPNYPVGRVIMEIDMSDSAIVFLESTTVEALSSTGKHSPTAYIMGRCVVEAPNGSFRGCHYWITLADNKKEELDRETPDVVGFLVLDGNGNRIAYGTGPVLDGDIFVAPTAN
jgi:hypothetical protein